MNSREIMVLTIEQIAVADRVGFYNVIHAARLSASIAADGQHDPIHVRRNGNAAKLPWTLVAGLHRMRATQMAGMSTIDAIQVADANATQVDLLRLELSENLDHSERRPIERAILIAERARLEEASDHPGMVGERSQTRAARARWNASASMADGSWRERTAAAAGCSLRSFERYIRLYRDIVEALPDLAEQLNFHPLGESLSAMTRLATFKHADARRKAAEAVLSRPDWLTMDEALSACGIAMSTGNRVDPEKLGAVMMNAWCKMPLTGQRAHVEWLVENVTPGMAGDMVAGFRKRGLLP